MKTQLALLVIVGIVVAAQILLKYAALFSEKAGTFWDAKTIGFITTSLLFSFLGQIFWFHVLKTASLGVSYLFFSLVFILVPAAGWLLFGEKLQTLHFVSIALILAGIAVIGFAETTSSQG